MGHITTNTVAEDIVRNPDAYGSLLVSRWPAPRCNRWWSSASSVVRDPCSPTGYRPTGRLEALLPQACMTCGRAIHNNCTFASFQTRGAESTVNSKCPTWMKQKPLMLREFMWERYCVVSCAMSRSPDRTRSTKTTFSPSGKALWSLVRVFPSLGI